MNRREFLLAGSSSMLSLLSLGKADADLPKPSGTETQPAGMRLVAQLGAIISRLEAPLWLLGSEPAWPVAVGGIHAVKKEAV